MPSQADNRGPGAGFALHRQITDWGIHCSVIAPSLIPTKPGENKKCDRLDAQKLARYLSTGLLTEIRVPAADEEAARAWYDTASQ